MSGHPRRPPPDTTAFWGLVAGVVVFGGLFAPVWAAPGQYLFGTTEDGLKNYYTVLWYALHDRGLHFSGMNYPFGEHIVFTDNQPLLALLLRWLRLGQPGGQSVIATVNLLMLAAQVVTVPVLAVLLRRCRLPVAYCVVTAALIALLTPQLNRLLGHYALAYSCAIPLVWYGLVRAFECPARAGRWWALVGVFTLVLGCLHPYYLLISGLLVGAHLVVGWWQARRGPRPPTRFWFGGALALGGPLLVFQVALALTDPYAADRLSTPYGFLEYSTSVWSVFFPVESPVREQWQRLFHTPDPTWEGYAYVGLVATGVAIFTLVRLVRRARARQWARLRWPALPPPLRVSLWAATLILLFAMGWPFRWGLQGLLDVLGPLRQFRSIGRFAWIFYYVFSVYTAYALYQGARALRRRGRPLLAAMVLVGALSFWAAEAVFNGLSKADRLLHPHHGAGRMLLATDPQDPRAFNNRLAAGHRVAADFQAILPLPFYSLGSEKLGTLRSDRSAYHSMRASLEVGLPIATAMLSRTALWQAQSLVQLLSAPPIDKTLLPLLPSTRPFLLVVATGTPLTATEERLVAQAQVFYRDSAVVLAALPPAAVPADRRALTARFDSLGSQLRHYGAYQALRPAPGFVHNGLDYGDGPRAAAAAAAIPGLLGQGSYAVRRDGLPLFEGPLEVPGRYEASVWAYLRTEGLPWLQVRQYDGSTGRLVDSASVQATVSTDVLGDWVRLSASTTLRHRGNRLKVWLDGRRFVVDEFCLRPTWVATWRRDSVSRTLVWNNFPLPARPPLPAGLPAARRR